MLKLDRIDRHILELMQENGRISNLELAELVGLSPSPCSRRVKALEDAGLIDTHVTLLNARQLGLTLTAYIHISMDRHTPERYENFDRAIQDLPEVLECDLITGNDADYQLKVVVRDMEHYQHFLLDKLTGTELKVLAAGAMALIALSLLILSIIVIFGKRLAKALETCDSPFEDNVLKKMKAFGFSLIPWALYKLIVGNLGGITTVIFVLVVLLFISVFNYGAKLQRESDETL